MVNNLVYSALFQQIWSYPLLHQLSSKIILENEHLNAQIETLQIIKERLFTIIKKKIID
jgi:hypothetical protein